MLFKKMKRAVKEIVCKNCQYIYGRNLEVFNDDILIVSYPKSGNTWLRFLIGSLIYNKQLTFEDIREKISSIYLKSDFELKRLKKPRYLATHEYFDPRYKKIIYLIRDPRSVAVSYFFYAKKIHLVDYDMTFEVFLDMFLENKLNRFGSWAENVVSWIQVKQNDKNFLLIKYEELVTNTFKIMQKIAKFLNIPANNEDIYNAIEWSSFSELSKLERKGENKLHEFKSTRKDIHFIRKGDKDEWKHFFDKNLEKKLYKKFNYAFELWKNL